MKPIGVVRKVDRLGRLVIPKEVRDVYGWDVGTPIEIMATDEGLFLRMYRPNEEKTLVLSYIQQLEQLIPQEQVKPVLTRIRKYVEQS
jgi:AbrB family transcriptional regulator (stage V sporulation protein T)